MVARRLPQVEGPQIPAFYAGKSLLITGATGFMGKVLIERLLHTCPDIGELYLLMREKKDVSPEKRLMQLKQSQAFDEIKRNCPSQLDKLRALCGDTSRPRLGLTMESIESLREVSVVFHVAATVKFDEEITKAVDQNIRSVTRLLDICDNLPHVQAVVHVSTAYAMSELKNVEEKVYKPPIDPEQLCSMVESLPSNMLNNIVPHLLGDKPNTYTFTKALAEAAVAQHQSSYPIAIFRPTIVISSARHPYPGWIENLNGPSGIIVAAGKGLMHTFHAHLDLKADLIPVDIAIDTLIAVGWKTAINGTGDTRVYNCSTVEHPTTWRDFYAALRVNMLQTPFDSPFWYPSGLVCSHKYMFKVCQILLQTIPLYVGEYAAKLLGIKPKISLITANQKLTAMSEVLAFFGLHEWRFDNENVRRLRASLSPADAAIYNTDPRTINWNEHYKNFILGTRRYLLKEKDQDIDEAKRYNRKLYLMHSGAKLLLFIVTLRTLLLYSPMARSIVYGTLTFLLSLLNMGYKRVSAH